MNKFFCAVVLGAFASLATLHTAEAARAPTVTLKWTAHTQTVAGYEVYYGRTANARMRPLFVPRTLNLKAPTVQYNVLRDLGALPGQQVCFRVKAYDNGGAKSEFSTPVCTNV
jgi:hypothetical protein